MSQKITKPRLLQKPSKNRLLLTRRKAESQAVQEELANNPNTPVVGSDGKKQVNVVVNRLLSQCCWVFLQIRQQKTVVAVPPHSLRNIKFHENSFTIANVSTSQCERIILNSSDLPAKGAWSTSITYSSPSANGVSQSVTINVEQRFMNMRALRTKNIQKIYLCGGSWLSDQLLDGALFHPNNQHFRAQNLMLQTSQMTVL